MLGATALLTALVAASCGSSSGPAKGAGAGSTAVPTPVGSCIVRLHGKGSAGAATETADGRRIVSPDGNAEGWGGRQWLYDTPERLASGVAIVTDAARGCERVVVHGFSNGGAFAAKLACAGEDLDGRLAGVVVDDPVTDAGVRPCAPATGVRVVLYWTGALAADSAPGASCEPKDWTCEGGSTIGIDAYAQSLGVPVTPSAKTAHEWYLDAPELITWA